MEALSLTGPTLSLGFCDASHKVVADLDADVAFEQGRARASSSGPQACSWMQGVKKAWGAGADGDLPPLKMAEELLPFLVSWHSVLVARPQGAAPGEEGEMGLDGPSG